MLTEAVILVKLVKVILVTVNRLLAGLQLFWCCAMLTESVILVKLVKVVLVSNVICLAARRHSPQRALLLLAVLVGGRRARGTCASYFR